MTFAVPLKVTIRLVVWDKDPETGAKTIRDIKEQEVYFGDIPLMTENGTFIINGTERVIVSQLHRSPGVFFSQPEKGLFAAQIIPYRGSWVEFEYDAKNLLHVRIDRKRKFLATVFLRALGMKTDAEILKRFYKADRILVREGRLYWKVSPNLVGLKLSKGIFGPKDASGHKPEIVHAGKKITAAQLAEIQRLDVQEVEITEADLEGAYTRRRHRGPEDGRGGARGQRAALAARPLRGARRGQPDRLLRGVLPRARRDRADAVDDGQEGLDQDPRGGADRDLPPHAAGRPADARLVAQPVRGHVPERAEVRLLAGRPAEAQHQARALDAAQRADPPPRGHHGGDRASC